MSMWSGTIQEIHLKTNAKASLFISLYFIYDIFYNVFNLSISSVFGWIGIPIVLLFVYWLFKGIINLRLQPKITSQYEDEYLKHIYQKSLSYAFYGAMAVSAIFILADDWLTPYFTIKDVATLNIAIGLFLMSSSTLWWLYRDAKEEQTINAEQEG